MVQKLFSLVHYISGWQWFAPSPNNKEEGRFEPVDRPLPFCFVCFFLFVFFLKLVLYRCSSSHGTKTSCSLVQLAVSVNVSLSFTRINHTG